MNSKLLPFRARYLFASLIFLAVITSAQNLRTSKNRSYYTYIFSINNKQAKGIYDYNVSDSVSEKLFTQPIDSFLTDSNYKKPLPVGHYMYVNAINENLHYELKSINSIDAYFYVSWHKIMFFPYFKSDLKPVTNALVKMNKHRASFDKKTNAYRLHKTKEGFITVTLGNEEAYFSIDKNDRSWDEKNFFLKKLFSKHRGYYRYNSDNLNKGYIAVNKPKYLPKDTVKFKALILTKKGKYYTGDIEIGFGTYYDNNKKLTTLKPVTPGAYVYEFVLGDSLISDETYYIEIRDPKTGRKMIDNGRFRLEDYQLKEATYHINSDQENYSKGNPVILYMWGKDANGLNLLDTRVDVSAQVTSITKYNSDSVFIPNVLWHTTQNLDPLGETKIIIPDSLFPDADLSIDIKASFNNSNNETHDTTFSFEYSCINKKIITKMDSSYVVADYLLNAKSTSITGKMIKTVNGESITEEIKFPFKEKINPNVSQYEFYAGQVSEALYNEDNYRPSLYIVGYRTVDSVFLETINPHGIDILYSVLKESKEVEKGNSKNLQIRLKDGSKDVYYVKYHYTWMGESRNEAVTVQLYDKALDVNIEQPYDIYPGQKTKIKVKVTDDEKKPVENVNVTAYSVNAQFGRLNTPNLTYFGKKYYTKNRNDSYDLDKENEDKGDLPLSETWRNKMRLDTMPYYKMLYPKNGIHYNYDSVQTINAQFSPFLFDKGKRVFVYIVYIDNYPVYYYDTDNAKEYAFIASVGYHTIRLRTIDKEYAIDSVLLKQGLKLDLAIDINRLPKNIFVIEKNKQLTSEEKTSVKNSVISIYDNPGGENYLWQDNKVVIFSQEKRYSSSSTINRFGGFFPKEINYAVQNTFSQKFSFEPGYDYIIKEGNTKMISNSLFMFDVVLKTNVNFYPEMGIKAATLNAIKLKTPINWFKDFIKPSASQTSEGNGTYAFEYTGDSTICLIRVQKIGNDTLTRFYGRESASTFYDLQPGFYNFTFITFNKFFIRKDSIKILADGTLFQRFSDKPFKKYIPEEIKDTTKHASAKTNWLTPQETSLFNVYNYDNLKGKGAIKATLLDKKTKESIPFANVVVYQYGVQVAVGTTDMDGNVFIRPLPAGRYNVKAVYVGYQSTQINDVIVFNDRTSYVNLALSNDGVVLYDVAVMEYSMPKADPYLKSGSYISRESFQHMSSKEINSIVSTQAGVILSDNSTQIQVRGARSGSTNIYIDGEKSIDPIESHEKFGNAKQLRNKFSDYAYWQPNLITDKNGEASFEVTFPDNITKWRSYAIAMDNKKHSGEGFAETKSYKNIMANLAMPRFLLQGDRTHIIGKALNYTNKSIKVNTSFKLNDKLLLKHDTVIQNSVIDKMLISPINTDSIKVTYSVEQFEGAKDGEEKGIPVLPLGVEETKGMFFVLNKDTTFSIKLDSGSTEIYIQNNPLDFMLKEIEELKNYPYSCMEQTASKLNALLMEEKINNHLNQDFKYKKEIKKLLSKLAKGQKANGSWGWWEDSPENTWMTSYIIRIINKANAMGYEFKTSDKAKEYLLWNLSGLRGNELLSVLNTFSEMKVQVPYIEYLKKLERDSLTLYQKFLITKVKQENNLSYDLKLIMKAKKETILNGIYWGEDNCSWYDNSINTSLLAYKILEAKDSNNVYLSGIRSYFLEIKNQNRWKNTVETATILETILPAYLKQSDNKVKPSSVILKGATNENISSFPYKTTVTKTNEPLTICKTGSSSVFFTSYQKQWNNNPAKKEDYYSIKTYYEVKGKITDTLIAGVPTELVIEVNASKKAEYIMIDVPIPAGCSYDDNRFNSSYYEVHREYFKNKTSIFCQQLIPGKHIFKIKLQPRFTGIYSMNPVKAELMYFPVFYGRNEIKKTLIK